MSSKDEKCFKKLDFKKAVKAIDNIKSPCYLIFDCANKDAKGKIDINGSAMILKLPA